MASEKKSSLNWQVRLYLQLEDFETVTVLQVYDSKLPFWKDMHHRKEILKSSLPNGLSCSGEKTNSISGWGLLPVQMMSRNKCIGSICWYRLCLKLDYSERGQNVFGLGIFGGAGWTSVSFIVFIAVDLLLGVHQTVRFLACTQTLVKTVEKVPVDFGQDQKKIKIRGTKWTLLCQISPNMPFLILRSKIFFFFPNQNIFM